MPSKEQVKDAAKETYKEAKETYKDAKEGGSSFIPSKD